MWIVKFGKWIWYRLHIKCITVDLPVPRIRKRYLLPTAYTHYMINISLIYYEFNIHYSFQYVYVWRWLNPLKKKKNYFRCRILSHTARIDLRIHQYMYVLMCYIIDVHTIWILNIPETKSNLKIFRMVIQKPSNMEILLLHSLQMMAAISKWNQHFCLCQFWTMFSPSSIQKSRRWRQKDSQQSEMTATLRLVFSFSLYLERQLSVLSCEFNTWVGDWNWLSVSIYFIVRDISSMLTAHIKKLKLIHWINIEIDI